MKSTNSKRKRWPLVLGIVIGCFVLLIGGVVIAGSMTNWFGFYGPASKIALASKNSLDSGNFTCDGTITTDSADTTVTVKTQIDSEKRELNMTLQGERGSTIAGVYDGNFIVNYFLACSKTDISSGVDTFFNLFYGSSGDGEQDWEKTFRDFDENLYNKYKDDIDYDKIDKHLIQYFRKLNNDRWLEENAGFSQKNVDGITYYRFTPDLHKLLTASLECFEGIFKNEDTYQKAMDYLDDRKEILHKRDFEVCFGIADEMLVQLELSMNTDTGVTAFDLTLSNYGETTVDVATLKKMLDKCK